MKEKIIFIFKLSKLIDFVVTVEFGQTNFKGQRSTLPFLVEWSWHRAKAERAGSGICVISLMANFFTKTSLNLLVIFFKSKLALQNPCQKQFIWIANCFHAIL